MANIVIASQNNNMSETDGSLRTAVFNFMTKLAEDHTTNGLHVEPIHHSVDPRARTARVNQQFRAVLFQLEDQDDDTPTFVYYGTWNHDDAIDIARRTSIKVNPVNGTVETLDEVTERRAEEDHEEYLYAIQKQTEAIEKGMRAADTAAQEEAKRQKELAEKRKYFALPYDKEQLTDKLGLPDKLATRILDAQSEEEVLHIAEKDPIPWRQSVILDLAVKTSIDEIWQKMQFEDVKLSEEEASSDKAILEATKRPASKMQFTYAKNQEELQRVIEGGDMGAWRVFLHPEQRRYVENDYKTSFRLLGGAGTGKTVVLLHRTERLAQEDPNARIVLTTFNTVLAENLERDLNTLNPDLPQAENLGDEGIYTRGPDSLANTVLKSKHLSPYVEEAGMKIVGSSEVARYASRVYNHTVDNVWEEAVTHAGVDLEPHLANPTFLEAEYVYVVLGNRITSFPQYARVRRPGRGSRLGRKQRRDLWKVFESYHENNNFNYKISYPEVLAIAAEALRLYAEAENTYLADYVLIDEGQDLSPAHWLFIRALVAPTENDIFICEDNHQRIYSHPIKLTDYNIPTQGCTRKLKLNYRTTAENLHFAQQILKGGNYVDMEDIAESTEGYVSARSGPKPTIIHADDLGDELDKITAAVQKWIDDRKVNPDTIAVLTRTTKQQSLYADGLIDRGLPATTSISHPTPGTIRVMTMHRSKGMEFTHVVLPGLTKAYLLMGSMLEDLDEEEQLDAILRERSLFYVAATRARDKLLLSHSGDPTEFLSAITAEVELEN